MNHTLCAALAAACTALPLPALALTDEAFREIAEAVFQPVIERHDIPGMAVGVTIDGRHYLYVHGEASRETGAPVTGDTIFELGSVSKLFNVTLAALADERGLMSLEAPISDHLPELAGSAFGRLSPLNLATHTTGGLPLQVPGHVETEAGLLAYLAAWEPPPGPAEGRSYSNVSIGLLGLVAGDRFGAGYAAAVEDLLFPALGLESTHVAVPAEAESRYAYGYSRDGDRPIRVNPGLLDAEAYGVKSTARDMLRFLDANLGLVDLPADLRAALGRTRAGYFGTAFYVQAMVWERYPWPTDLPRILEGSAPGMVLDIQPAERLAEPDEGGAGVLLSKTGSTNGFGAYVALVPSEGLGIVVLANRYYPNEARIAAAYRLVELLSDR